MIPKVSLSSCRISKVSPCSVFKRNKGNRTVSPPPEFTEADIPANALVDAAGYYLLDARGNFIVSND